MQVKTTKNGNELKVAVDGRIDTKTAPEFQTEIIKNLDGVTTLIVDLEKVNYISSAGLRVFLSLHNKMSSAGVMKIINTNQSVMDVFEITGFSEILNFE